MLVDAAEGVLPQTKFVVGKALARGMHPIVVVNKVDRADARPDEVHTEVFDLFAALGATDAQLDFPMLYRLRPPGLGGHHTGRPAQGSVARCSTWWCATCRPPTVDPDAPFAMVASILEYDPYLGRVLTGRRRAGSARG